MFSLKSEEERNKMKENTSNKEGKIDQDERSKKKGETKCRELRRKEGRPLNGRIREFPTPFDGNMSEKK